LCVAAYVLLIVGWPSLILLLLGEQNGAALPLVMADPLYGVLFTTVASFRAPHRMPHNLTVAETVSIAFLWTVVHSAIAVALFAVTLSTFDRRLGRISESSDGSVFERLSDWNRRWFPGVSRILGVLPIFRAASARTFARPGLGDSQRD
jgi:hypothetical protein